MKRPKLAVDRMAEFVKYCLEAEAAKCGGLMTLRVSRRGSVLSVTRDGCDFVMPVVAVPKERGRS